MLANGNSFDFSDGCSMGVASAPGEGTGDGSRPASSSWLFAVTVFRMR
jgi:hypothetical protein